MYGISNSQQQGGGGGSAASYKAIKATLTPSDWQEVAKQPYFVGSNAMEWAVNGNEDYEKSQTTKLGLVSGNSYTITAVCDGQTYTQTAVAEGNEVDGIAISYDLHPQVSMYVDIYDDNTGSKCYIYVEATSFVITNFAGEGFGTTIQATIADSAIKVNSAVTMYTNTSEKIAVGEKTNGNVTLIAPSVPETAIPYGLEIVGTDTEGLFEIVNGYVPAAGITDEISEGVDNMINEFAGDYLPLEKTISNTDTDASTRVAIEGTASPYIFRISDDNVYASDFVRLYPMDEDTETWLNEHTLSSIITEELQKFTFKVDTPTLPTAYSFKYIIECR